MNYVTRYPGPKIQGVASILSSVIIMLSLVLLTNKAESQTDTESTDGMVYELSPFVVDATNDAGYLSRNSLAGSRMNTSLADIPSQVVVMNKEFLDDVAATSLEDAMIYSLNTENSNEFQDINSGKGDINSGIFNNGGRSRTRGLASSSASQDLLPTDIRTDSYNTERFTFTSGPNAILFGLGSPAGLTDVTLKRAYTERQLGQLRFRIDDEGSFRTEFDFNLPVIEEKLAVRAAVLNDESETYATPTAGENRRYYLTATYKPFKKTTVRVSYENVDSDELRHRNGVIRDSLTPWLDAGMALFDNSGIAFGSNPTNAIKDQGLEGLLGRNNQKIKPNEATKTTGVIVIGQLPDGVSPFITSWNSTAFTLPPLDPVTGKHPKSVSLAQDRLDVFPQDLNYNGNGTRYREDGYSKSVTVEHKISENWYAEAVYHKEELDQDVMDLVRGLPRLSVDPNMYRYQPDGTMVANEFAGKYLISHVGTARVGEWYNARESARLSVAGQLDLTDRSKWLGVHNIVGNAQWEENWSTGTGGWDPRIVEPSAELYAAGYRSGDALSMRVYVDDPEDSGGIHYVNSQYDFFEDITLPDGTTISSLNHPLGYPTNNPDITKTEINSLLFAIQSYWWDNRIVTTYGKRRDTVKSYTVQGITSHFKDFVESEENFPWDSDASGPTDNYGVVFHANKWLSFHWSSTSTFAPGSQGHNPDNSIVNGRGGDGKDYGFTLNPFDGKLYFRVNWYETFDGPINSNFTSGIRTPLLAIEETIVLQEGEKAYGSMTFDIADNDHYFVGEELAAEGVEFNLIANPLKNLRLSVTVAKNKATLSNIGLPWVEMVNERIGLYEKHADKLVLNSDTTIRDEFLEAAESLNLMVRQDGFKNQNTREWRVNIVTRYSFIDGMLDGSYVGAACRWRSASAVGYEYNPAIEDLFPFEGISNPLGSPDLSRPIEGTSTTDIDLFLGYKRKILNDKMEWNVQLNIRNLFDDRAIMVQKAYADGSTLYYRVQPPRQIIITNTFSF